MFNQVSLPATPGNARHLLAFAKLNGMKLDESVEQLAATDLLDSAALEARGILLNEPEIRALQYVLDRNLRAILLGDGPDRLREVALAALKIRPATTTMILAQPKHYALWATVIRHAFPTANICVFGNPRYKSLDAVYPEGIDFNEAPDLTADFMITSFGSVLWHNLLTDFIPHQTIVEEMDSSDNVPFKFMDGLSGLFKELPSTLFLQDVNRLPVNAGQDLMTCLQTPGSRTLHHVGTTLSNYIWAGWQLPLSILSFNKQALEYLSDRGYSGVDTYRLLSVFGACTEMISRHALAPLDFFDNGVVSGYVKQSGVARIVERERELEARTGQSIEAIARTALAGDETAQGLLKGLRSTQWANVKAASVRHSLESIATSLSRTLVVAENPDLIRALRLTLSYTTNSKASSVGCLVGEENRESLMGRFIYPDPAYLGLMKNGQFAIDVRPLNTLIVSPTDLDESHLLRVANFVVLAEWPVDSATYDVIRSEYVEPNGARLVHCTLTGTVEEIIRRLHRDTGA